MSSGGIHLACSGGRCADDPEAVLRAAMGGNQLRDTNNNSGGMGEQMAEHVGAFARHLVFETTEDELLHGYASDARFAFYARNVMLLLAVLLSAMLLWKLCASHRCWQRRYQRYTEPVPLDYRAQVRARKQHGE